MSNGQLTVEEGASPELMARVNEFAKNMGEDQNDNITMVPNPDEPQPEAPEVELDFNKQPDTPEEKPAEKADEQSAEGGEEAASEESSTESDALIKVNFRGKDRELTTNDISAALGRAEANQKRADKLAGSDEYKMGVLMSAAKGGDKSAQKKLQALLVEFTGAETPDDMVDNLEDVEGNFDESSVLQKQNEEAAFDEAFSDVSEGVDFQKTLDIVSSDLKGRMPAKVFEEYWKSPDTRRTMYDLVALGRLDELMEAFDQNLSKLPFGDQLKMERDPEEWGSLFAKTVREQNALKSKKPNTQETSDSNTDQGSETSGKSAADSVSSGTRGRSQQSAQSDGPDFLAMSKDPVKFAEWKRKNGLPT